MVKPCNICWGLQPGDHAILDDRFYVESSCHSGNPTTMYQRSLWLNRQVQDDLWTASPVIYRSFPPESPQSFALTALSASAPCAVIYKVLRWLCYLFWEQVSPLVQLDGSGTRCQMWNHPSQLTPVSIFFCIWRVHLKYFFENKIISSGPSHPVS